MFQVSNIVTSSAESPDFVETKTGKDLLALKNHMRTDTKSGDFAQQLWTLCRAGYKKSDKTPETGKFKGDERAHVIDKYDIYENNCTTKSLEAVNGSVPGGEIKYQTTVTIGGFPVVTEDGTKNTYAPKDLNRQLNQASQQSGTNVQKVTDEYEQ